MKRREQVEGTFVVGAHRNYVRLLLEAALLLLETGEELLPAAGAERGEIGMER